MNDLLKLRQQRQQAFWGEVLPYLRYVMQSGLAIVTFFLLIVFAAWYTTFLQNVPQGLPVHWILLILFTPLSIYGSVRTYMRTADIVFMLPLEVRMREYFAPAWRSSVIGKTIWLLILALVAFPFYVRADMNAKSLSLLVIVLIVAKCLGSYGSWQELRMNTAAARVGYRLLRYVLIIGLLAAFLWLPLMTALIAVVVIALVYLVLLRIPGKASVPWERLIATERNHAAGVMRLLGWFVDVPNGERKVSHRRWLSFVGNRVPWIPAKAFRFLVSKTLVRGELLPILIRFVIIGIVFVLITRESWFGIVVYLLFILLAGMQMTSLRKQHTDTLWLSIYPIPPESQRLETVKLITQTQVWITLLLWLPLASAGDPLRMILTFIAGLVAVWLYRRSLNRKWLKDIEAEAEFD
ncbi:ABC transporter permease [Paenibacillus nicotianae]|uniref:ABC transporter permease n=1 Tax=Paenibacillus nicotianae TaxID=1526551 RepID=A0ABW4UNJ8_9BACL